MSSIPAMPLSGNNSGQVVHIHVLLTPSSIIWYQCKSRGSNSRLWKRYGLPSIMPGVSPLLAQDRGKGDEHLPQRCIVCVCNYTDHGNNLIFYLFMLLFSTAAASGGDVAGPRVFVQRSRRHCCYRCHSDHHRPSHCE